VGIDLIVLGLATMDGLHGQSVAEHEGDVFPVTEVCEPVPGEGAFGRDDQVVAVGSHDVEECRGVRLDVAMDEHGSLGIEDADVEASGVEIDAAVVAMLTAVESHGSSSCADARLVPPSSLLRG
jgi:hypothetical protein